MLCPYIGLFKTPFFKFPAALFWLHSVSVQRRDRSLFPNPTLPPLFIWTPFPPPLCLVCFVCCASIYFVTSYVNQLERLLFSGYTVHLSKDVTGALLPTPPSLLPLSLVKFSLPALRVYLSKDVAGTPPSPILSRINLSYLSHTPPFPSKKTKPECRSTSRLTGCCRRSRCT